MSTVSESKLGGNHASTSSENALLGGNEVAANEKSFEGVPGSTGEAKNLPLTERVQAGIEVASDLFDEAKARLAAVAREFDDELKRKNPESRMDAGWQVAEDTFYKTREVLQTAIEDLRIQLESKDDEDESIMSKTKGLVGTGIAISKEKLAIAQEEFEKASSELRERLKTKEEENRMKKEAEQVKREMQGAPTS
jgi:hypothetical protein